MRHVIEKFLTILAIIDVLFLGSLARADDTVKKRPRAPADYQIVSSDRAGAYFIARPLKNRYDKLVGQLATLRRDIAEARITSDEARGRVDQLSKELQALKQQIEKAKIYIPGATVHNAKTTESFPIAADDFLLVDASNVELRGWDRARGSLRGREDHPQPGRQGRRREPRGNQRDPSQGVRQGALRLLQRHRRQAGVEERLGAVPVQRVPRPGV